MTHNPECGLDCVSAGAVRLDNQAKHTPGPWRTCRRSASRVVAGDDDTIANTGCQSDLRDQHEANARLTAASPEMYEALKLALPQMIRDSEDPEGINWWEHIDRFKAAIAKAEGRDR